MNSKDHKAPNVDGTMFAGTWNHMFGPGRFETQCRIVIDVKAHKLVAAQALNGLNWLNLSVAEKADLSESLFEGNDVSSAPAEFDLEQVGNLPEWAIPAVGKAAAVVVTGSTDVRCYGLAEGESADSNVINDVQSGPATRTIERALCRGKTATGHEESVGPTDRDIVEGAERMARILLQSMGFDFFGESVRASSNPRAVRAWNVVGALLEEYNGTDLSSAVDALEEEGVQPCPRLFTDCSVRSRGLRGPPGGEWIIGRVQLDAARSDAPKRRISRSFGSAGSNRRSRDHARPGIGMGRGVLAVREDPFPGRR
ncbi:hypothetical protein KEH59_01980 (plasmid) [Burkholderia contaminans]|uniref:hypothetical protein n=1 Tax=Burkholderia contaminans TaxID=488447 RepID=UPI001BAC5610|nr:hypothetical protein [Burkholderia contaminans]QUN45028.1 hypothetical protein KEH59_01980 [Burkholderia contaminans]